MAGYTEQTFVVFGMPDEKEGERLVVLHKLSEEKLQLCLAKVSQADMSNLWKPRADQFFQVESFYTWAQENWICERTAIWQLNSAPNKKSSDK